MSFDHTKTARLLASFDSGLSVAELAPWTEQLRGAVEEVERLTTEREQYCDEHTKLRTNYLDLADAILPSSKSTDDLIVEVHRLRAEVARLTAELDATRPVVEAAEAEFDNAHRPDANGDPVDCECNVCVAVRACRASKEDK